MILDERTEFADATALSTAGTGIANVGDVIPLTVARDISSPTKPAYLVIQVTTQPTSAGAPGIQFQLVSDAVAPPLTNGTATVHWLSASFTMAQLPVGTVLVVALPSETPAYETFLGVQQVIATAALTGGAINAFLTLTPKRWKAAADGI